MNYRVDELARAAGVSVDTVRFYQSRGLLPAPERRGRIAFYSDGHLARLRRIRELNRQGLTLDAVGRVLAADASTGGARLRPSVSETLLSALDEAEGDHTYDREQLANASGVPPFLLDSLEELGLIEPLAAPPPAERTRARGAATRAAPPARYTDGDRRSLAAGRTLLEAGIPLGELLSLAKRHADHTGEIADAAIELFQRHVRKAAADPGSVASAFRELLPAVTTLIALHFQRTLIRRARARLAESGDEEGLAAAIAETESSRLEVSWR